MGGREVTSDLCGSIPACELPSVLPPGNSHAEVQVCGMFYYHINPLIHVYPPSVAMALAPVTQAQHGDSGIAKLALSPQHSNCSHPLESVG